MAAKETTKQRGSSSSNLLRNKSDKATANNSTSSSSSSSPSASSSSSASSIYIRYVSSLFLLCIVCFWFESSKWFSFISLPTSSSSSVSAKSKESSQEHHHHHIRGSSTASSSSTTTFQLETENGQQPPTTSTFEDEDHSSNKDDHKKYSSSYNIVLEDYLAPMQMMRQYKQWHGVQALQNEWKNIIKSSEETNSNGSNSSSEQQQRKFAVALYWCPDRAGNVLSSLFNTITWAIITNRTLLFQWDEGNPPGNNETLCDSAILQRQAWIPLYRDWKDRLPVLMREDYNSNATPPVSLPMDATRRLYDETIPVVYFPMIKDVLYNNAPRHKRQEALRPSTLYRNRWMDHPVTLDSYRKYLLDLEPRQKQILARLYAEGVEFLFGMLMDHFFTLFPLQEEDAQQQPRDNNATAVVSSSSSFLMSIVLHSRHTAPGDDGSFVNYEMDCLEQILKEHVFFSSNNTTTTTNSSSSSLQQESSHHHHHHEKICRIVFMSDRPRTIHLLRDWIQQHDLYKACTVLTTLDDDESAVQSPGPIAEHGPHAGVGFFRDLQLVQHEQQQRGATTSAALIGDGARSSFALVKNMVTYYQRVQQVKRALDKKSSSSSSNSSSTATTTLPKRHALPPSWETDQGDRLPWMCTLPTRGYNYGYGPNTPTFYRNNSVDVPPTKPQVLLQEYQRQHNQQALLREVNGNTTTNKQSSSPASSWRRRFGLVTLDCADDDNRGDDDTTPHRLMNSLVWAMLTNRTLLWRTTGTVVDSAVPNDDDSSNATTTNDMKNACGSLKIQSWLPRWDEWSPRWNLKEPSLLDDEDNNVDNGGEAATTRMLPTMPLPAQLRPKVVTRRKMAQQLLEYGADFVNGMLFLQVFENPNVTSEESDSMKKAIKTAASSNIPHEGMANTIILEDYYDDSATTANDDDRNKAPIEMHMNRVSACLDHVLGELEKNDNVGNSGTSTLKNPQPLLPCQIVRISARNKSQQGRKGDTSLQQVLANHNCTITLQSELQPRSAAESLSFLDNIKTLLPIVKDNGNNRPTFQGWIGERPSFLMEAIEYQTVTKARTRFPLLLPTLHTCDLAIDPTRR